MGIKNRDDLVGFCDKWHFTVFENTSKQVKLLNFCYMEQSWGGLVFVTGDYHYTMGIALNMKM